MEPKPLPRQDEADGTLNSLDEDFLEEPESWDVDDFSDILDVDPDWPV